MPFDVVFSEIMWLGSSVSSSDEFIELYNNTDTNIDLAGWQITKLGDSGEELMLTIPSGIIPTKGFFIISNNDKDYQFTDGESILNIDPDYVDSDVSLSNSKFQLKLFDGQYNNGGLVIDTAGDGENPANFAGSNSTSKASMYRINLTNDGNIKTAWATTSTQKNLDTGILDFATPENSGKPEIEYFQTDKNQIDKAKNETITFNAKVLNSENPDNVQSVNLDLSQIRTDLPNQEMCDEISCGDQSPNDEIYTFTFVTNINDNCGNYQIPIKVINDKGLISEDTISVDLIQTSDAIQINEISPRPEQGSQEEFIELYNNSNRDIDLYAWQLDDKLNLGSKPYTINVRRIIKAYQYQAFYKTETGLTLNDSGDFVRLVSPTFREIESIEYSKTTVENQSYNLFQDTWKWSSRLTPGWENTITEKVDLAKNKKESSDSTTTNKANSLPISISQIKNQKAESYVTITGLVSASPNTMTTTYFYIQDEMGGIQVYCHNKDFPNLQIGDKIQVIGRASETQERRIKIDNANDITILEHNYFLQPKIFYQKPNYLDYEGMLVHIDGVVTETSGDTFYVQNNWGEIVKIYIKKSTGIDKPKMYKGDLVKTIGIVDITKAGFQVLPVLQNHVQILKSIKDKVKNDENKKNNLLISTVHAANDRKVPKLSYKNKYLQDLNHQNNSNTLENTIKTIVIVCSLFLIYLIGDYLWKNRLRLRI